MAQAVKHTAVRLQPVHTSTPLLSISVDLCSFSRLCTPKDILWCKVLRLLIWGVKRGESHKKPPDKVEFYLACMAILIGEIRGLSQYEMHALTVRDLWGNCDA